MTKDVGRGNLNSVFYIPDEPLTREELRTHVHSDPSPFVSLCYSLGFFHEEIVRWAKDRNLIEGSTSIKQFVKLIEEAGELAAGLAKQKEDHIKDGIGDMLVVLTIIASQNGWTLADCLETAWNEIKDRKGKMVDGVFVKETDL